MGIADDLIIGSARIDQWRNEIKSVVGLVLSSLSADDYIKYDLSQEYPVFKSKYHYWTLQRRGEFVVRLYRLVDGQGILVCMLQRDSIDHRYVEEVRLSLDDFVGGMMEKFASIEDRLRPICRAVRSETRIVYELTFGEDARVYRKESKHPFPLPIGTSVFVFVEGESGSGEAWFNVVGYELSSRGGSFDCGDFIVQLEFDAGSSVDDPGGLACSLEENGWEEVS